MRSLPLLLFCLISFVGLGQDLFHSDPALTYIFSTVHVTSDACPSIPVNTITNSKFRTPVITSDFLQNEKCIASTVDLTIDKEGSSNFTSSQFNASSQIGLAYVKVTSTDLCLFPNLNDMTKIPLSQNNEINNPVVYTINGLQRGAVYRVFTYFISSTNGDVTFSSKFLEFRTVASAPNSSSIVTRCSENPGNFTNINGFTGSIPSNQTGVTYSKVYFLNAITLDK